MSERVTVDEAVRDLGRTRRCLEGWRNAGCPGFSKQGERVFVDIEAVLGWVKETGRKLGKKAKVARTPAPAREVNHAQYEIQIEELDDSFVRVHFRAVEKVVRAFLEIAEEQLRGEIAKRVLDILRESAKTALNSYYDDLVERENFEIPGIEDVLKKLDTAIISEKLSILDAATKSLRGSL